MKQAKYNELKKMFITFFFNRNILLKVFTLDYHCIDFILFECFFFKKLCMFMSRYWCLKPNLLWHIVNENLNQILSINEHVLVQLVYMKIISKQCFLFKIKKKYNMFIAYLADFIYSTMGHIFLKMF